MEAFSLLKYWRPGASLPPGAPPPPSPDAATTLVTAVAESVVDSDGEDDDDDGPFFDLEFAVPDEADDSEDGPENLNVNRSRSSSPLHSEEDRADVESDDGDDEKEFKFTLSPSANDRGDPDLSLSPSDDLFFKGKIVEVKPSSFVINSSESEPNSRPQFTASLLKSATKFRIFMAALKKSKANASDKDSNASDAPKQPETQPPESQKKPPEQHQQKKLFTVKFKIEEVPIMSLFTRDNSSRGASVNKSLKQNTEESLTSATDEKRFSKEVMQKYLRMVKPLYIKVSKRYGGKLRFSGQLNVSSRAKPAGPTPATAAQKPALTKAATEKVPTEADSSEIKGQQKQGNLPAGLKVVCKQLGKSRSASSAVAATPAGSVSSRRRDDSLLQQQDGIQGAILHCKRSFNASRECESSQLPRSVSDPLHEISPELSTKSTEKSKDKCP
ncbi:probable membrane-associated kinase regulator 2 [Prosopis cineraria]|uniref:probable membrane-associated kinase regulator 2 n=1 Tax=Prosopis cineraria TaxID=364024 RepID=UPI0024105522|nr:probable membrane-associated kinase regulator 2 [Prosopis cineraria]